MDVNHDNVITRDDLEECLPAGVESQQLIQHLLKQWDMVTILSIGILLIMIHLLLPLNIFKDRNGAVNLDDFQNHFTRPTYPNHMPA